RRRSTRSSAAGTAPARRAARRASGTGRGRTPRNRSAACATRAAPPTGRHRCAEPFRLAEEVEAKGMLAIDQRLGFAIAALLADIGFDRVAAEMPDHRRRAEADGV